MGGEHGGDSSGLRGEGVPALEVTGEELELLPGGKKRNNLQWVSGCSSQQLRAAVCPAVTNREKGRSTHQLNAAPTCLRNTVRVKRHQRGCPYPCVSNPTAVPGTAPRQLCARRASHSRLPRQHLCLFQAPSFLCKLQAAFPPST